MSVTEAPPAEGLLERVQALVPSLRAKAQATEDERRVLPEHFDALAAAGVFRMCVPRRFGGYEADFRAQCDVLAAIATGCPSSSWVSTILSAVAWVAAVYPDEAQEEMFGSGEDPRFSGAFSPTGTIVPSDGGYVLNGRWPFNTGCHGSHWTFLNAIVPASDGPPLSVFVRSSELTILDDWYATGMAGTGSNSVAAEEVFVPARRALPLPALVEGQYPQRHNSDNPYFNYQVAPVLIVNAGGTPVGTARGALDAFLGRLPGRPITYTNYEVQSEASLTHLQVGEAALKVDSAEAHVRLACALLDEQPGPQTMDARVRARAHIGYAAGLAREAVALLFTASGASSIQPHVPIQRFHRDIDALANHAILNPAFNVELLGRSLVGLEPNTTLL